MVNEQGFQMRVAVVFSGLMMLVVFAEGGQRFQPLIDVCDQSAFVVVHIDACSDVHGGDQHHAFLNAALFDDLLNLGRDVNIGSMGAGVELQVLGETFHGSSSGINVKLGPVSQIMPSEI